MEHCEKCIWFGGYIDKRIYGVREYKCNDPFYITTYNCSENTCCNYKEYEERKEMTVKEAYEVLQAEWVKLYNVEVGDTVRVLRKAKTHELGWDNSWESYHTKMNESVGNLLKVGYVGHNISLDNGYGYPFFVLEFVKKAEPKIEINVKINGKTAKLSQISEETLSNLRNAE